MMTHLNQMHHKKTEMRVMLLSQTRKKPEEDAKPDDEDTPPKEDDNRCEDDTCMPDGGRSSLSDSEELSIIGFPYKSIHCKYY